MNRDATQTEKIPFWAQSIKNVIFGAQNERIESFIDQFFRLTPEARTAVTLSGIVASIFLCLMILIGYFAVLGSLDDYLDNSLTELQELQTMQYKYLQSESLFNQLKRMIDDSSNGFSFITYVDSKAKNLSLKASNFPAQPPVTSFPANHPLYGNYQLESLSFDVDQVSLKQLVALIKDLQSVSPFMQLKTLKLKVSLESRSYLRARISLENIAKIKR